MSSRFPGSNVTGATTTAPLLILLMAPELPCTSISNSRGTRLGDGAFKPSRIRSDGSGEHEIIVETQLRIWLCAARGRVRADVAWDAGKHVSDDGCRECPSEPASGGGRLYNS